MPSDGCLTAFDQRGVSRPQGAGCDIGAYEFSGHISFLPTLAKDG
ncbi:MAG TPA: choice-of-anchor Q domain-containing protein [Anaerolineae bacterium]|nr:choice-of-anchor Q domain-containing protein [Anaerolineae bacterium]